ncbi:hypothetical protein [Streptomyces sp. MUM 178J]|uniref:hypothetical protein n=1 Tax=Streptomyces sp. MUM 178J TaxID=2791991 RepID=UPI001F03C1F5|nr:hypothetical protein [Streptomyces sp. MUM 178J]WRQ80896.1 hypothetical protein I3F59_016875 [Streptomyces sp. MUM 178J]
MSIRGVSFGPAALGLLGGALWWWAVLRWALVPDRTGLVEVTVAAGGWGLSLLPVHVTAARRVTRASPRRRSGAGSGPS